MIEHENKMLRNRVRYLENKAQKMSREEIRSKSFADLKQKIAEENDNFKMKKEFQRKEIEENIKILRELNIRSKHIQEAKVKAVREKSLKQKNYIVTKIMKDSFNIKQKIFYSQQQSIEEKKELCMRSKAYLKAEESKENGDYYLIRKKEEERKLMEADKKIIELKRREVEIIQQLNQSISEDEKMKHYLSSKNQVFV